MNHRSPSIHIKESQLANILKEYFEKYSDDPDMFVPDIMASQLLKIAKKDTINNRSITISNQLQERKIKKIVSSGLESTYKFAQILYAIRRKYKHRGITKLTESHKDWGLLKELTHLAEDFCKEFNLGLEEGFKEYLDISISRISKFNLARIKSMHESICSNYAAYLVIENDLNPHITDELYKYFYRAIVNRTGVPIDYSEDYESYAFFVKAAETCKKLKANPKNYMEAQFKDFEWRNGLPYPSQLIGDKAEQRYSKYLFENPELARVSKIDKPKAFSHLNKLKELR